MDQRNGTARRDRILAAASQEFAAHGMAGARMERIAASAGVNKQLLFHYFGSKAGLYGAATAAVFEAARVQAPTDGQPVDRLRELVDSLQRAAAKNRVLLAQSGPAGKPHGDKEAAGAAAAWFADAVAAARRLLEDGQRSGHFRDDIDAASIAELIVTSSLGMVTPSETSPRETEHHRRERLRDTLVRVIADYCVWR